MTFTVLPAVDVAGGRVIRLGPGSAATATTSSDPLTAALDYQAEGAEWIHLVDVDAAFGRGSNAEQLAAVIRALDVKVELAGGICDAATLERALATDCDRVVLATTALDDPTWCTTIFAAYGDRVAVGLDVRIDSGPTGSTHHRLAARGGDADSGDLWETLTWLNEVGCPRYVVTDVSTDGTLGGPNVALHRAVTRATAAPVIASGGVSTLDDLVALAQLAATNANLEGSIVGSALAAGRFTLPEAQNAVSRSSDVSD